MFANGQFVLLSFKINTKLYLSVVLVIYFHMGQKGYQNTIVSNSRRFIHSTKITELFLWARHLVWLPAEKNSVYYMHSPSSCEDWEFKIHILKGESWVRLLLETGFLSSSILIVKRNCSLQDVAKIRARLSITLALTVMLPYEHHFARKKSICFCNLKYLFLSW